MRRLSSIVAFLGFFITATAGFSFPATTTRQRRHSHRCRILHPIRSSGTAATATTCTTNSIFQPIATQMTKDDSLSEEEKTLEAATDSASESTDATAISTKDSTDTTDESKGKGFSLILLPTLLFKFAIVMCVKFATDVVVFPMLWLYRLARLGKRKIVNGIKRLLGPFDSFDAEVNGGVNGDNTASSSGSS